ncbi:DUF2336 domain-containing protein [uncultured Sphingomonas sp.]|uniref:DUF2336 domain-containing protein n=1 Tax=uncultured Sphingomonas sp. TaxID=158754 RepID=UPI002619E4FD|nr:DUF2336 domain-containing protein [uncultured Sphingomonas sp.]
MSLSPSSLPDVSAAELALRAAAAERRAGRRLGAAIEDFFRVEQDRLDDRARALIGAMVEASVSAIERDVSAAAARLLAGRGEAAAAKALAAHNAGVLARLIDSGLLRDRALMDEIVAQARVDLIDEALIANRAPGVTTGLLARLRDHDDPMVRDAAIDYLLADSRRRAPAEERRAELPAELHHQLVWWIAAALRERLGGVSVIADRALVDAAMQRIAHFDGAAGTIVAAHRLAAAIDADVERLPGLLIEALTEGRLTLFAAFLAHALGIEMDEARALALEPDGERLWIALRALGMERDVLARIGWALGEADRTRDVEALPDAIDAASGVAPEQAGAVIAPLMLTRDFRQAVRALSLGGASLGSPSAGGAA